MPPTETENQDFQRRAEQRLADHPDCTIVVKYGGNAMIDVDLKRALMGNLVLLNRAGFRIVLVHGGGPDISNALKRMGKESVFVHGLRVTDAETMEIVEMVLAGKTNKSLVSDLHVAGARAVGLSGKDGHLLEAEKQLSRGIDVGFVGAVTKVNCGILHTLMETGYIPVICSVADDGAGQTLNINADHAAGHIAAALKADELVLLTDVAGVMEDPGQPDSLLTRMNAANARDILATGKADKGMIPKLEACLTALEGGCRSVQILDGRVPDAVLNHLLGDEPTGTSVTLE